MPYRIDDRRGDVRQHMCECRAPECPQQCGQSRRLLPLSKSWFNGTLLGAHLPYGGRSGDAQSFQVVGRFRQHVERHRHVNDLLIATALPAEQHRCTSESEASAEVAGERWGR